MQVLPPNTTLGANPVAPKALPPNPVAATLGGKTPAVAPAPAAPVSSDLTGIATHIATNNTYSPAFVKALQDMQQHDPTFQSRLNDEVSKVSTALSAKQGAGISGYVHHAIPALVHGAQKAAAMATGVQAVHGTVMLDGKPVQGQGDTVGVPFLGGIKSLLGAGEKLVPRTAEEAAQHLSDVAAKAAAEHPTAAPLALAKGAATPETGGELGRQIRESLVHAPAVRAAQKVGFSAERSDRFRAAVEAHQKAGGGMEGFAAGRSQLQGELGREFFGHLKHFTPEHVAEVARVIDNSPLLYGQKLHAIDAIRNAVEHGIAPTEGDHAILNRVFGTVADTAAEQAKPTSSFWDKFVSYTNIPRAVRSSADVSAGLRQGLVVLVTHPKVWANAFGKSLKSFGSENFYQAQQAAIHSDPLYPLFVKWKVPFTDIGASAGKVEGTEEAFIGGQAAEHLHELPGINRIPGATPILKPVSNVIRRSDRAFTGFQNGTRFEMAKMLAEKASLLGHDLNDEHLGTSIAKVVGTFSGRGVTPKILEGHLTTLNALMFSPRLMAARLNLLSPVYYAKLDPFARAEAMRGARNLVASIGTVMFVAKMLGADVNFDPRSSNFTKIKIGNTRIDIAGGFSQYVRLIAQQMTGEEISSAGNKERVRYPGQSVAPHGDISTLSNLTKFARSKAAPIPSTLWDELSGSDFVGKPIKQGHELFANAPFITQDAYDALQNSGPKSVAISAFLSAIGLGVQSYKDKPPKAGTGGSDSGYGDQGSGYGDTGSYGDNSTGGYGG